TQCRPLLWSVDKIYIDNRRWCKSTETFSHRKREWFYCNKSHSTVTKRSARCQTLTFDYKNSYLNLVQRPGFSTLYYGCAVLQRSQILVGEGAHIHDATQKSSGGPNASGARAKL